MSEEHIIEKSVHDSVNSNVDDASLPHPHTSNIPVIPQLSVALGLLIFVFSVTYIGATNSLVRNSQVSAVYVEEKLTPEDNTVQTSLGIFDDIKLEAHSAFVWDVKEQKVLFNKNADDQLPLASVTKLMTALIAYELLDPESKVPITLGALKIEGDSGFSDGEEFSMQNLTDITLISSSNDGAAALSNAVANLIEKTDDPESLFVQAMNIKAQELGLSKTYFRNSTGLDISETEAGAKGSARDMALLMEYIISNAADAVSLTNLDVTTISNNDGAYHIAKNTNEIVNEIDGLIASKTGYTNLSGGNLVVAVNMGLNRPVIVAVLGSTQEGRFNDTLELIERIRLYTGNNEK